MSTLKLLTSGGKRKRKTRKCRKKRKKNTRRKKGGKIMSSIEGQKSTNVDCSKNNVDEVKNCYQDPISFECLNDDNVIQMESEDKTCFDKKQFCTYATSQVNRSYPVNNPLTNKAVNIHWLQKVGCDEKNIKDYIRQKLRNSNSNHARALRRRHRQQQTIRSNRRAFLRRQLIQNNGSYEVPGDDFWQGDMTISTTETKPCCSKCEPYGCMSYLGCGTNKCAPCDTNLQPINGRKRRCNPVRRRGGKSKVKRKKRKGRKKTHRRR